MKLPSLVHTALIRGEARFLRQRARLAQARKDWPEAARLWGRCAEKAPTRFNSAAYISALIYSGQTDLAEKKAEQHLRLFPSDENGHIASARIAEVRGGLKEAVEGWGKVLELRPGNRQALIRLGATLLSLGDLAGAEACAGELVSRYPDEQHGIILQAQIAQQRNGWASAAPLWQGAAERFSGTLSFLRVYGRALVSGGAYTDALGVAARIARLDMAEALRLQGQVLAKQQPYQDHSEFWQAALARLPDNADITRKLIHAALWARRLEDAAAALHRLSTRHLLSAADAHFVVGLANARIERGESGLARDTIRAFMRALRGNRGYSAAALRLNRVILACCPKRKGEGLAISRSSGQFLRMVRNARLSSGTEQPLTDIAALEGALQTNGATCFIDTDIAPDSCSAFIAMVRQRLQSRTPFSLVRLGDGEANAFQDLTSFAPVSCSDAAARERVWWGRTLTSNARAHLAAGVREASLNADAIGFPTREWFLRDVRLDTGQALSSTKSGRGLLVIAEALRAECHAARFSEKMFVSAHLPQDLHRWNRYGELMNGSGEIVLVSCHPELPDRVQHMFDVQVVHHVLLPPGDSMREMQHRALSDDELPPLSTGRALADLGQWPQGRLVLVGAGYAGKIIIGEAKQRGGIALDLGSIFDRWMGLHTRSYQDLA